MEYIDVINEKDEVIGRATRDEIYEKKLSHRIVHVMVANNEGELLLQLRDKHLSFAPNYWSTSAGGHVLSGESYIQAAQRELKEELGIEALLNEPYIVTYSGHQGITKKLAIYSIEHEGPFRPELGAIERIEFIPLSRIKSMIESGGKFHPELVFIIENNLLN